MAISWTDVVAIAPHLSSTPVATQNAVLAMATRWVSDVSWGVHADDGRTYLAAHLASSSVSGNQAGPILSETLGPMSRSYAGAGLPPGVKGSLALSTYGATFKWMMDSIVPHFFVAP